jgi:hypothetical protein
VGRAEPSEAMMERERRRVTLLFEDTTAAGIKAD